MQDLETDFHPSGVVLQAERKKIDQLQPILNLLAVDLFFSWPPPPSAVSQMLWVFRAGGTSEAAGAAAIQAIEIFTTGCPISV